MKKLNTTYGIYDNHKIYCKISSIFFKYIDSSIMQEYLS